jgi:hypothetical protein
MSDEFDLNKSIHFFFDTISKDPYPYSERFRELSHDADCTKSFFFDATINNVTSNLISENRNTSLTLNFIVAGKSFKWLTIKPSGIPGAGHGCFLEQPGKKNDLVTTFMGYRRPSGEGSCWAVEGIDPCMENENEPFPFCGAHKINHKEHGKANAYIDAYGGIRLLRDLPAGTELFIDYKRDVHCYNCSDSGKPKLMKKFSDAKYSTCSLNGCNNPAIICCTTRKPNCTYKLCEFHYDEAQINYD